MDMPTWSELIEYERRKDYFLSLEQFIEAQRANTTVYPPSQDVFKAFEACSFESLKVVIVGQDPYHGEGQAHGLSFSVGDGAKIPPSLRNIFKEILQDDRVDGFVYPDHGNLQKWAEQGVLLLNRVLTVNAGEANSHQNKGWEIFTENMLRAINEHHSGIVFMLWGKPAQNVQSQLDASKHIILQAPHPSPLSAYRGFFGCGHFGEANAILRSQNKSIIDWQI